MTSRWLAIGAFCLLTASAAAQPSAQDDASLAAEPSGDASALAQAGSVEVPNESVGEQSAGQTNAVDLQTDSAAKEAPTESAPQAASSSASSILSRVQIHGFVSEGGYISTANDYIGDSERGSLKLFE